MDVVDTLQEMFRDNTLLLDTHYATTALHAALDLLRTIPRFSGSMLALNAPPPALVYTHDPRILDFLATLCCSNGTAFPHNQNDIAAAIFVPPLGPPISTRIGLATALIEALVPPQPGSRADESGTWVEVVKLAAHTSGGGGVKGMFSAPTVPLHHMQCAHWLTAQLNLAAMVCLGQNYKSIHLVEGCHSWKEAFKALVQPSIPFDVSFLSMRSAGRGFLLLFSFSLFWYALLTVVLCCMFLWIGTLNTT
jgi:RIH domain